LLGVDQGTTTFEAFVNIIPQFGTLFLGTATPGPGIAAGTPATLNSPVGTIVPVQVLPHGITKCNSPVVYEPVMNCFTVLERGFYEITYYIQGTFLVQCPTGVEFAVFVDNILLPQSRTKASTPIQIIIIGQSFNITKTFCAFFSRNASLPEPCLAPLTAPKTTNCVQVRAITDGNDMAATCIDFIVTTEVLTPGNPSLPISPTRYRLSPAGTLQSNNAFEIVFKRLSEEPDSYCNNTLKQCHIKHDDDKVYESCKEQSCYESC
jgi:hypothetical protein